jgi:fumarate hydratase subunit beta
MAEYRLQTPLSESDIQKLKIGDQVLLTGTIYLARDAAHKRMIELIENNQPLPVNLKDEIIFYAGPCPPKPGQIIGPIAPTTSFRMDPYAPVMYEYGVKGTIGKGPRREMVKQSCQDNGAIYFAAIGGLSTILSRRVKAVEVVAYDDLGPEAIRRLQIEDFPLLVAYDAHGGNLYEQEIAKFENYNKNNKGVVS